MALAAVRSSTSFVHLQLSSFNVTCLHRHTISDGSKFDVALMVLYFNVTSHSSQRLLVMQIGYNFLSKTLFLVLLLVLFYSSFIIFEPCKFKKHKSIDNFLLIMNSTVVLKCYGQHFLSTCLPLQYQVSTE